MSKFELHCASNFAIGSFGMLYFLGFALGSCIVPRLADRYGRKKYFLRLLTLQTVASGVAIAAPANKAGLLATHLSMFFIGFAAIGRLNVGYCYMLELMPTGHKAQVSSVWFCFMGSIYIQLTVYYKFVDKSWVWPMVYRMSTAIISMWLIYLYLPESPKWLYDKGEYSECHEAFKVMAQMNGKELNIANKLALATHQPEENCSKISFAKYVKAHPRILCNLICMVIVWMTLVFCFLLISYQVKYFKGDFYINGIANTIPEMLAGGVSGAIVGPLGVKKVFIINYVLAFVCMLTLVVSDTDNPLLVVIIILGAKFGVSSGSNIAYVGNSQLFPTLIASTCFGICNVFSRTSTVFAPWVAELKPESISESVFCAACVLGLLACLLINDQKEEDKPDYDAKINDSETTTIHESD